MARFAFEDETFATLALMPFAVRYRLDRVGLKLSLAAWQELPVDERLALCEHPVDTDADRSTFYARCVRDADAAGFPAKPLAPATDPPPWRSDDAFAKVAARAEALGRSPARARWEALADEEAYVLWRLADPTKDEARFAAAAREFGLL
jgi:hypothetical protein